MQRKPLAAINVTPLVDVLLILLVIMMLAMPLFVKRLPVELPRTGVNAAPIAANTLHVALDANGQLYLEGTPSELASVLERIQDNTSVELAVDESTPYGQAAVLVARLQEKQPREVILATR
jgi:biopolymer transport protein ExbD